MINKELIKKAISVTKKIKRNEECITGEVGCALLTSNNNIFVGISISCACDIGFCAEHSAIANMITNGESKIKKIVAVNIKGRILSPCGRCRELIYQINNKNKSTDVIIKKNKTIKLGKLLNYPWQNISKN